MKPRHPLNFDRASSEPRAARLSAALILAASSAAFAAACGDAQPVATGVQDPSFCIGGGAQSDAGRGVGPGNGGSDDAGIAEGGGGSADSMVQSHRDSGSGTPFVPGPPYMAPAHQGNLIHVKNGCAFPLWIHGVGGGGTLAPDNLELKTGDMHDYTNGDWPFAYVTAYLDGPQQNMIDQAELTLFPSGIVSYRLAYIDAIGLPMELQAVGQGADCKAVGCYATQAQIVAECPDGLLSGKRCLSAGTYCGDAANAAKPYCHALDAPIAKCAQSVSGCQDAVGASTADAYRCEQVFGDHPALCAAINRGMVDDPTNKDNTLYYGQGPYNSYAAWLHDICPGLYAFPYDDVQSSTDAFHACQGSTQLNITFCPAG